MSLRFESPGKEDLDLLLEFYNQLSLDEGKLQFPNVSAREMKGYLKRNEKKQREFFKRHLKDKKHNVFLFAVMDGKKVGYVHGEIKNGEGHFERVFVKEEYRNKGIARRLYKELEKEFKKRRIREIWSTHYYNNHPSRRLHEALGFKPYSMEYRKKI